MAKMKVGSEFYRHKNLKSINVHVSREAHKKLYDLAAKEDRSLQKTIRRILEEYAKKVKK